jgi:outer membrane protein OmpA-like peptidoglycan-associated protein
MSPLSLFRDPELGTPVRTTERTNMSAMSPFRKDVVETIEIAPHVHEHDFEEDETWRINEADESPLADTAEAARDAELRAEAGDFDLGEVESTNLSGGLASPFETGWTWTAPALPLFAEVLTDKAVDESPILVTGESPPWTHRWADWRPVHRPEEAEVTAEPVHEQQVAPPGPIVSRSFSPQALAELPAVLQAKPIVRLEATVPTELILWMVQGALNNRGTEPGWADRLLVDLKDLPKAGPSSTVHVAVFQTVPFLLTDADKLQAFERYCMKQHPTKVPPIDALSVGLYLAHRDLEQLLQLPAGAISTNAGLPLQMPADQAANYKLVVYAILPNTVGRVIAPRDQRSLRGFDFGKWLLTEEHERLLDSLGRELVRSLFSRRSVTRIAAAGHTDPVGTRDFNIRLGRHRAEAVAKRLKEIINAYAASAPLPAGVVDRIEYVVASYGEDRPISRSLQSLNRRVEVTVYRDYRPPPQLLDEDITLKRQTDLLLSNPTRDPDTTKRLQCLLLKMRQSGVDDRYVNDTQVFLINRDNKKPGPTEWNRVRSTLLDPALFNPQVPDDRVIANLERLDEEIAGGIVKMIQISDYAQGPDWGLGLLALANAFKQFNAWVMERFRDQASIYSCYADLFL